MPKHQQLFKSKSNSIPTIGIQVQPILESLDFDLNLIAKFSLPAVPPWSLKEPRVILNLCEYKKSTPKTLFYMDAFNKKASYDNYTDIFTDG